MGSGFKGFGAEAVGGSRVYHAAACCPCGFHVEGMGFVALCVLDCGYDGC